MRSSRSLAGAALLFAQMMTQMMTLVMTLSMTLSMFAAPALASEVEDEVLFSFADGDIDESSGLVDGGAVMVTTNDSGDDPVLYTVDKATGETTSVTEYSGDGVDDVEALAPGEAGVVWAGDIGDNDLGRVSVEVYQVSMDAGDQTAGRFRLVYPDSPHNAETLLAHPRTGRLFIVTKAVSGGTVYEAPGALDEDAANEMTEVARVPGLVTDGAFFPDGKHLLLRGYGTATVYTFPDFRSVGTVDLPEQEQGEAVAIDGSGQIYMSSEGENSDVLRITLPVTLRNAMQGEGTASPRSVAPTPSAAADPAPDESRDEGNPDDEGVGFWVAAAIAVLAVAGWVAFTASRPRSRRRP